MPTIRDQNGAWMTREKHIEKELLMLYGPLMNGAELRKALGFNSATSFNRALRTGKVNVRVFRIPERRGKFAMTADVAKWLLSLSQSSL
jgi:hypothetical protein